MNIIDFIFVEAMIILASCVIASIIMTFAAVVRAFYTGSTEEIPVSAPGTLISLTDAAAYHSYQIKWIMNNIPEYPFAVGDRIFVLCNIDGDLCLEHLSSNPGRVLAISREYLEGIRVEIDDETPESCSP